MDEIYAIRDYLNGALRDVGEQLNYLKGYADPSDANDFSALINAQETYNRLKLLCDNYDQKVKRMEESRGWIGAN